MKIKRIFVEKGDCQLWSVCYPEDRIKGRSIDIFRKLFKRWNDTAYLQQFFIDNHKDLERPFWNGLSISEAIDKVLDEAEAFERELRNIDTKFPGYELVSLTSIFKNFHSDLFVLDRNNLYHKKGKPDSPDPIIRIYALEFDSSYIITGGLLKLSQQLDKEIAKLEIAKINKVRQFLKSEGVYSRKGLDEL